MKELSTSRENTSPADELASVREQIRVLKCRESELRVVMLTDLGARVGKHFIVSVKAATQRRINADKLRRDYPAIAEAVTERVTFQQLFVSGISDDGEVVPLYPRARSNRA